MRCSYSCVYFADKRKNSYMRNGNVRDFRIQQMQQWNLHHKMKRQQNLYHETIQQRNLTAETTRQDDSRNNKAKRQQEQQEKRDRLDGTGNSKKKVATKKDDDDDLKRRPQLTPGNSERYGTTSVRVTVLPLIFFSNVFKMFPCSGVTRVTIPFAPSSIGTVELSK